jgi:D-arabinose 1-dehydrogenase-like Zn-dependent alcohol dehydrogenase
MQSEQPKKEEIEPMRAITLESFDSGPTLQEIPTPQIAPNEVLVRVRASSVNPIDNAIASGMLKDMVEHEFPIVLGRDFAGVVEQAGSDVRSLSVGDEVFGFVPGMGPTVHNGSWAELIAVPESVATRKPDDIDAASAGAAPMAAITALSALDALGVSEGDTVLIVGANGGVGSFAVQLAADAGATVIAPALPEDEEYLSELGVSEVLDRDADVAALVHERYPEGIGPFWTSSPTPQKASTPTRRSSTTTGAGPRRSLRPGKDRSATTSGLCRPRRTCSGSRDCWRPGRSGFPSSGPTSSSKRAKGSGRSQPSTPRASGPSG